MRAKMIRLVLPLVALVACSDKGSNEDSPAPASPNPPAPVTRASTFAFESRAVAGCPTYLQNTSVTCTGNASATNWCACHWPPATQGTVYLYTLKETRTATAQTLVRTAYVYKPNRAIASAPVLLFLHGGHGNGEKMFEKTPFARMADGRGTAPGLFWLKNTATCKFKQDGTGFENANGGACSPDPTPPSVNFKNSLGFLVVFPNGLLDPGPNLIKGRHWEDGRVPSPGFTTAAESRDDVGFIDALIGAIKTQEVAVVDPKRIYISGASNGGMMTMRVACNSGRNELSEIRNIAAYAVSVAALPEQLLSGSSGRETCAPSIVRPFPLIYIMGKDAPTPDCPTQGCTSPTVSGDGMMPFGAPGAHIYHLGDTGQVIGGPNTQSLFIDYLTIATDRTAAFTQTSVGYFTTKTTYTYSGSAIRADMYETSYGLHEFNGGRWDFNTFARIWEFVSSFRREESGAITYTAPSHMTGVW